MLFQCYAKSVRALFVRFLNTIFQNSVCSERALYYETNKSSQDAHDRFDCDDDIVQFTSGQRSVNTPRLGRLEYCKVCWDMFPWSYFKLSYPLETVWRILWNTSFLRILWPPRGNSTDQVSIWSYNFSDFESNINHYLQLIFFHSDVDLCFDSLTIILVVIPQFTYLMPFVKVMHYKVGNGGDLVISWPSTHSEV